MSAPIIRVKTAEERITQSISQFNVYLTSVLVNIGVFATGSLYSWTSPAIPKLRAPDSWLHINTDQASWVGSLIALGSMFGPFIGGYLVDWVGRRPVVVIAVALGLMSWAVLYHAETVWELCVARVVAGMGGGIVFTIVPLYLAEIAQDEVRSALVSLFNVFFTAGLLLEYLVGPYVSYWSLVWISCVAPVIFFICSPWIPESPFFHLQHHYDQKAYNNLMWLRKGASDEQIAEEIRTIKESLEDARNNKGSLFDLFSRKGNRNALLLSCGCIMFQQLSGINVMLFYSQTIFQLTGQSSLDPSESSALVGVILLLAACAAVPFTHIFGLKIMLLVSSLGMSFFLGLMGLYFFLLDEGKDTSNFRWLPLVSLIGYVIIYSFGFGPLPWALMAEVFPPNVKGLASAVTSSCCWAISFVLTKLFPLLVDIIGAQYLFWTFAAFCVLAFLFVLILIPDTRGMSFQEIQDLLNKSLIPEQMCKLISIECFKPV